MQRVVDISLQRAQFPMRYNHLLAVNEVSTPRKRVGLPNGDCQSKIRKPPATARWC